MDLMGKEVERECYLEFSKYFLEQLERRLGEGNYEEAEKNGYELINMIKDWKSNIGGSERMDTKLRYEISFFLIGADITGHVAPYLTELAEILSIIDDDCQ